MRRGASPSLQPNNFPLYTLCLIIHMQHTDTTGWLPPLIIGTTGIEQQLSIVLLIGGNVAMPIILLNVSYVLPP